MICRNCGQKINVFTKECGWCKTPVDESSFVSVAATFMAVLGLIVGGAIGFVFDPSGVVAGLTAAVGGSIGYVLGRVNGNKIADGVSQKRSGGTQIGRGCPNCGYDPGYDARTRPDKYCPNCGKRFGGER